MIKAVAKLIFNHRQIDTLYRELGKPELSNPIQYPELILSRNVTDDFADLDGLHVYGEVRSFLSDKNQNKAVRIRLHTGNLKVSRLPAFDFLKTVPVSVTDGCAPDFLRCDVEKANNKKILLRSVFRIEEA